MHVHGNPTNLSAIVELNRATRTEAARRAADTRRKLANSDAGEGGIEASFEDSLGFVGDEAGPTMRQRRRQAREGNAFRAASVSEDEEAADERTSFWA